jgi:D-alanyl-lipoteichoic acid acyltransferase DltB (MBOAT superfamily)
MLLGGFWHGASWNFIIWGALHGVALAVHKVWTLFTGRLTQSFNQSLVYKFIGIFITFHFVCFCWIFFHAKGFQDAMTIIHQIRYNFQPQYWPDFYSNYKPVIWMISLAMALHVIPDHWSDKLISKINKKTPFIFYLLTFFAFVWLYGYFKSAEQVMPIYLQF